MTKVTIDNVQPNEFLYILRHRLKINQVEMAANLKLTRHILSKIELGKQEATIFMGCIPLKQVSLCGERGAKEAACEQNFSSILATEER